MTQQVQAGQTASVGSVWKHESLAAQDVTAELIITENTAIFYYFTDVSKPLGASDNIKYLCCLVLVPELNDLGTVRFFLHLKV